MSPCSHWHWCLSPRRSRCATNTLTHKYTYTRNCWTVLAHHVISQRDTTWVPKQAFLLLDKCGCELAFLTFLPFALSILSLRRGTSPCLWTVWRCWGSWEKGWVGPSQLEWSEDAGPHEAVEVKAWGQKKNPTNKIVTALIQRKCTHDKSTTTCAKANTSPTATEMLPKSLGWNYSGCYPEKVRQFIQASHWSVYFPFFFHHLDAAHFLLACLNSPSFVQPHLPKTTGVYELTLCTHRSLHIWMANVNTSHPVQGSQGNNLDEWCYVGFIIVHVLVFVAVSSLKGIQAS